MFQSKEHLIRSSDPSLWGFAGLDLNDDHNYKVTTRLWNALNSKAFNVLIVLLVLINIFIILSQILIDGNWIQDPSYSEPNCTIINSNNTINGTESGPQMSPTLLRVRHILSYIWLTIISFFLTEVLLRIYCGKTKLFIQLFELLDALLVIVVFTLSVVFYSHNSRKQSTLLLIGLRLWRVLRIINQLVEESQQKILQTLSVCEKEKTHCEHKIDILILKVEDLEHEVAYLKEKLKKSEKDNKSYVQQLNDSKPKKNAKRTQSSQSYCPCRKDSFKSITKSQINTTVKPQRNCSPINYTLVDIETQPLISKSVINEINDNVMDLDVFAKNLAQSITIDVIHAVIDKTNCHSINTITDCCNQMTTNLNEMQNQSNNYITNPSSSSRHSSYNQFINNSIIKSSLFNDSDIYSGLYLISESFNSLPQIQSKLSPNMDSSSAAKRLNDDSDIERIKRVDFNVNEVDIPLSSL